MKKIWLFVLITCLISWCVGGIIYLSNISIPSLAYTISGAVYMLIPAATAILLQKYYNKEPVKKPLLISFRINRWFFIALLTPILLVAVSLLISLLFPGVSFSSSAEGLRALYSSSMSLADAELIMEQLNSIPQSTFILVMFLQGLIAGCTINAFFAFGEELGWRGYMLRHLSRFSFMKVSLFTGFI